jgi:hypothetical protein
MQARASLHVLLDSTSRLFEEGASVDRVTQTLAFQCWRTPLQREDDDCLQRSSIFQFLTDSIGKTEEITVCRVFVSRRRCCVVMPCYVAMSGG